MRIRKQLFMKKLRSLACIAVHRSRAPREIVASFAQISANQHTEENPVWTTSKRFAKTVGVRILQTNIREHHSAVQNAICKGVKIAKIEYAGIEDVYNMYVEKHNNFSIIGGLITHNCDALRYFCKTMIKRWRL